MARSRRFVPLLAAVTAVAVVGLSGCGIRIPADPDGTLDRVADGELRVGASPASPLVEVSDGEVGGSLASLIEGFAATRNAHIVWSIGSEEQLVDQLEDGQLDLAIGGMTDSSPWSERVALTRAYPELSPEGARIVLLLPMGENAWQSAIEQYLDEEVMR